MIACNELAIECREKSMYPLYIMNSEKCPLAGAGSYSKSDKRKKDVEKYLESLIGGLVVLTAWLAKELYGWLKGKGGGDLYDSIGDLNAKITQLIERFDRFFVEVKVDAVVWNANTERIKELEKNVARLDKLLSEVSHEIKMHTAVKEHREVRR